MYQEISAIQSELLERYPLREWEIVLPRHTLSLLAAEWSGELATPDTDPDDFPYWTEIWEAGRALAGYLLRGPALRGPVLELGAGVGLVGIAAALRGATVLQTDRIPDALRTARVNASRCGVEDRVQAVVADWRAWPLRQRFRLVLGADIIYRPALHPPLRALLRQVLTTGGIALLADPGRDSGDQFARRLLADGWHVTEYPLPMPGLAAGPGRLLRALAP
jgi:predicted nicotinamide N-methyase